jgi:hypothetical protein
LCYYFETVDIVRQILIGTAAILFVTASQQATAQPIIIVPSKPLRDWEEYFGKIISEWHQLYLGRKPSDKEHAQMMQKVRVGTNGIAIQAAVVGSDEYYKKHGSTTQGFMNAVFSDVVGRKATPAEVATLQAQVNRFGRYKFAIELISKAQLPAVNPLVPVVPIMR